jgi:hypothetical protein
MKNYVLKNWATRADQFAKALADSEDKATQLVEAQAKCAEAVEELARERVASIFAIVKCAALEAEKASISSALTGAR